jgi:hypothetical protein
LTGIVLVEVRSPYAEQALFTRRQTKRVLQTTLVR